MRSLLKLTWVELKLFTREPITMVFTFALPVIFLFVMGGVFGNTPDPDGVIYRGVGAIDYYVPAYIGLVIASIGIVSLPVHLTAYRERGVLRRLRASSISIWSLLGSHIIVSFIISILGGILLVIIALIAYDAALPKSPGLFILAVVLCTLSFSALGFFIGSILPNTRAAQGLGLLLFFVMLILAGAGPPREVMTEAMQIVGDIMPLRYVILTLQDPWLGFGWHQEASLIIGGILIISSLLSVRLFKWE
ncbi:MAG: ABC transporter permease [Dehalococcoidia bacterium]|nr:MAG: ABC transporter permease [Dehalococcoidia bacterium]